MSQNRARPKRGGRRHRTGHQAESATHKLIQDLRDFEEFQETILPALRKDVKAGLTAEQLQKKYSALAQARLISEALTNENAAVAIPAAKDLLDRTHGKATEKKIVKHQFDDMSDEELNAILESEEEDLEHLEDRIQ